MERWLRVEVNPVIQGGERQPRAAAVQARQVVMDGDRCAPPPALALVLVLVLPPPSLLPPLLYPDFISVAFIINLLLSLIFEGKCERSLAPLSALLLVVGPLDMLHRLLSLLPRL